MKLIRYVLIIICSLIILPSNSSAAPSEEELTQYLSKLNWTLEELEEYLDFYELDLSHFETMAELQKALGTPITRENLQDLLASLNLSLEDAEDLLSQFGESILDYKFIENLELAINFYVHHNHDLAGIADFLSYIGLTNEEITSLFNHISSLQQKTLHLKINQLDTRLKKFHVNEESTGFSQTELQDILSIFQDVFAAYGLTSKYYLMDDLDGKNKVSISYPQLVQLTSLTGKSVLIEMYNSEGALLVDLTLSGEMMASDFVIQSGEQLINVGKMAGQMNQMMLGDKIPKTASSFIIQCIVGILLLGTSILLKYFRWRKLQPK